MVRANLILKSKKNTHFSLSERNNLVAQYAESKIKTTSPNFQLLGPGVAEAEYKKQNKILNRYQKLLPLIPVSRCPFCNKIVSHYFDPYGLDGMWWEAKGIIKSRTPDEKHCATLLGAVNFHDRMPDEVQLFRVQPGPAIPFVVPELLQEEGEVAVISNYQFPSGDTAYITTYFFNPAKKKLNYHDAWGRQGHYTGYKFPWDFDLAPWAKRGKLLWIKPGDETFKLRSTVPKPYLNLPGLRAPQELYRGKIFKLRLPNSRSSQGGDHFND